MTFFFTRLYKTKYKAFNKDNKTVCRNEVETTMDLFLL